jgi:hypothetical protein
MAQTNNARNGAQWILLVYAASLWIFLINELHVMLIYFLKTCRSKTKGSEFGETQKIQRRKDEEILGQKERHRGRGTSIMEPSWYAWLWRIPIIFRLLRHNCITLYISHLIIKSKRMNPLIRQLADVFCSITCVSVCVCVHLCHKNAPQDGEEKHKT